MHKKPNGKLDLEGYIELLDRMLQREGFANAERDEIFNHPENIGIISDAYKKYMHPRFVLKELNREPVRAMYAIDESINEDSSQDLTNGQEYAVKLMQTLGLQFISTPLQLKNGTLSFNDEESDIKWQISKRGYLRKLIPLRPSWNTEPQWQMIYKMFPGSETTPQHIDDQQYKDLAKLLYEKIIKSKKKPDFKESNVNIIYKSLNNYLKSLSVRFKDKEIRIAITRLYEKYIEQ